MKAKFVIGRAGSGKTSYCLDEIVKASDSGKPLLLLVPNQFSLEMEKNLVKRTDARGMDNAQVLSFERLAYRVFSLYGKPKGTIIDDIGKAALIKKILYENRESLKYYGGAYRKEGFVNMIGAVFTEFYKYGVDAMALSGVCEKSGDSITGLKLFDLKLIFSAYNEFLKDRFISSEQSLDLLSAALDNAPYFHGSKVWIDGFYRFTAQDYKVIQKLFLISESLTISLTMPELTNINDSVNRYDPFYETISAAKRMKAVLGDGALYDETVRLKKKGYYPKPLIHLEREYFNFKAKVYEETNNNVFITSFSTAYEEVKSTAAAICGLVRDEGFRYKDIAVCACDFEGYSHVLYDYFTICGIPCFFDTNKNIYNKRLVEMIRALLETGVSNFKPESVIRLLRTNLLPFETSEIDILENYLLEYGISGYKWNMGRWGAGEGKYDISQINDLKNRFTYITRQFLGIWDKGCTVKEASIALFEFIDKNSVTERLAEETSETKETVQIWNIVVSMFERIVEVMGSEAVDMANYFQMLEGAFENVKEGFIPASLDTVTVGDLKRTRLPDIKVLFVLGLNDSIIPSAKGGEGLLSEGDRAYLADEGIELGPYGVREAMEEQFLVYRAITKPMERLYISYPAMGFEDNELRKSIIAERISRIFPGAKGMKAEFAYASEKAFIIEASNKIKAIVNGDCKDGLDLLKALACSREADFNMIIEGAYGSKHYKTLKGRLFSSKDIYQSVTRIEKYISCPFSYFAEYGLKAKERKLYGLMAVDIGSIYHDAIERLSREMEEKGIKWGALEDFPDDLVDRCVSEAVLGLEYASEKFVTGRIKSITKRAVWALNYHVKSGSFTPCEYEAEFGEGGVMKPVIIELNEGYRLIFSGRIDRVDIFTKNGTRYVKILDYKSGSKKFDLREAYYGLQLQLLLYMDAYLTQNKGALPGGAFYFRLTDPVIDYPKDGDDEAITDGILNALKLSGLAVNDSDIIDALHNGLTGGSNIIPVKLKKPDKDGLRKPDAYSSTASAEQFYGLMKRARDVIQEAGNRLIHGYIEPYPVRFNGNIPCRYCGFKAMCGFDVNGGYKYRDLYKLKKDEVLDRVKKD